MIMDARSSRQRDDDLHDERMGRAQERLSSFTSWMPDLHRVWALKPSGKEPSVPVPVPVPRSRPSSKRRREACTEVVFEPPMTAKRLESRSESPPLRLKDRCAAAAPTESP
jgi:hypothetical protein